MLENEDKCIVTWSDSQRSFKVIDLKSFQELVLPKYFRHKNMTSFQRQLNLYGFERINSGPDCGAYGYPKFVRGSLDRVRGMK